MRVFSFRQIYGVVEIGYALIKIILFRNRISFWVNIELLSNAIIVRCLLAQIKGFLNKHKTITKLDFILLAI